MKIDSKNLMKLPPASSILDWPKKEYDMDGRLQDVVVVLWRDSSGPRSGFFNQELDYIGEASLTM